MNRSSLCSLRKISLLLVVFAATLLRANSEETGGDTSAESAATAVPTGNATATETQPFRCIDICGDEEGELEDPDKVVDYQWNWRVPVCSGLSCDTATCSQLQVKLSLLDISESECFKHRRLLQRVAGCTCSEAEPFVVIPMETRPVDKINDDGKSAASPKQGFTQGWMIFTIVLVVFLIIMIGLYFGVRHDDKVAAKTRKESAVVEATEEP